jgi:sulfate permease, SulP family
MGKIISNCLAGIISGLMTLIAGISYATLIFSGSLSGELHLGICGALVSASVVGAIVALRSSSPYTIAGPDANISAILGVVAASVGAALGGSQSAAAFFSTMWTLLVLSSLIAGVFFYLVGQFHLGRWIRFIPYPVIGGFLAGTGWLLIRGAFKVMAGEPLTVDGIPTLMEYANVLHWLPGTIMAVAFVFILRRFKHFLVMPALLAGGIVASHVWIRLSGLSIEQATEHGWLLEKLPDNLLKATWGALSFQSVNWTLIRAETGNLLALTILAAIVILLNAASVEIATKSDVDLDRELTSTGLANIVAAPLGSLVGCIALSRTLLNWKAGANASLAGIVAALLSALVLLLGTSFLNYLPKPVLGALLVYLGSSLLIEWVYEGWFRFSRFDFFLVLMILFTIAARGFLQGVGIGLIVACMLFAFSYSRVSVIKHELSGAGYRSNVERSYQEQKILRQRGDEIYVLCLQGYIFFGTAYPLLTHMLDRVGASGLPRVRFVVLDFSHVSGLDSSSVLGFHKILQTCEQNTMQPIFANLRGNVRALLEEGGCLGNAASGERAEPTDKGPRHFPDLDYAMSWCEEQILMTDTSARASAHPSLEDLFGELFQDREVLAHLRAYLERLERPSGHVLFKQGQATDGLYFVESGEVTVLLELPDGNTTRLRTMGAGTVVGEMGLYLDKPRSGTIVTNKPCVLHWLSVEAFRTIREKDHELALAFHEFMVRVLANRLVHANNELANLLW